MRRSDEAAALWAQIASRADAVALYPRPLSETAAVGLTRERLGSEADDEFCRACHAATGGNPLFLRELLGALDCGRSRSLGKRRERGAGGRTGRRRSIRPASTLGARPLRDRAGERSRRARRRQRTPARGARGGSQRRSKHARPPTTSSAPTSSRAPRAWGSSIRSSARRSTRSSRPGERQARHAAAADALSGSAPLQSA